jgi:hypothetical protein
MAGQSTDEGKVRRDEKSCSVVSLPDEDCN